MNDKIKVKNYYPKKKYFNFPFFFNNNYQMKIQFYP